MGRRTPCTVFDLWAKVARLRAQRDALVEALDRVLNAGCRIARVEDVADQYGFVAVPHEEVMEEVRALLARVRGEEGA